MSQLSQIKQKRLSKDQAQRMYMEIVKTLPWFGSTVFHVQHR